MAPPVGWTTHGGFLPYVLDSMAHAGLLQLRFIGNLVLLSAQQFGHCDTTVSGGCVASWPTPSAYDFLERFARLEMHVFNRESLVTSAKRTMLGGDHHAVSETARRLTDCLFQFA